MPSLKDLKIRIESVKSTRKITKAMQMVAAAKLRRAQEAAEMARVPMPRKMASVMGGLAASVGSSANAPKLLQAGTGNDQTHLMVVMTVRTRPLRRLQLVHREAWRGPAPIEELETRRQGPSSC